jgi:hypothetical protein
VTILSHWPEIPGERIAQYIAAFHRTATFSYAEPITPAYGILGPPKNRFVRQIMRDVKLILILRNPIDRAWSRATMVLSRETRRLM